MSAVDVLDVLHDCALRLRTKDCTEFASDLEEAHASVAELIESIAAYLDGRKWYNPLYANKQQFDTFAAIERRLNAAIARCNGGEK